MIFKDYYKILELETSRVSIDDIKIAYRSVAKKYHPDVNVGDKLAEERIKDINEAYRVLSNYKTKRKYDRMWNSNVGKRKAFSESGRQAGSIFSDFFYMFFGNIEDKNEDFNNKKEIPQIGDNIETSIKIDIKEAFFGKNKVISLKTAEGKIKKFNFSIPEGIRNGEKIRLIGQGMPGQNGGKNGDLFIKIELNNKGKFKVKGYDLYTDLLLTPWEAVLGARTNLQTIDGDINMYIPEGIQTGELLRIPGKGYKDNNGGRGDLIAKVKIVVPKKITESEREVYKKLDEVSTFNPRIAKI